MVGTLLLRRFNGQEAFAITSAEVRVHDEAGVTAVVLEFRCDDGTPEPLPDTADFSATPGGDVVVVLPNGLAGAVGTTMRVPTTFDESRTVYVSRFYYVEHAGVNDNVVTFLDRRGNDFRVHWTGRTVDVNHYDGSKPDAELEIDAWFSWDGALTRGRAESG